MFSGRFTYFMFTSPYFSLSVYFLKTGPEFEERIKLNEAGNTKFNFLNKTDPYHAYYEHKIKEIMEGVAQEQMAAQQLGYIVSRNRFNHLQSTIGGNCNNLHGFYFSL